MKPKEIDRKLATDVMGWHVCCACPSQTEPYGRPYGNAWRDNKTDRQMYDFGKFKPSTNIAHAFKVVEKLWELGYYVRISNWVAGTGSGKLWECVVVETQTVLADIEADTPAMAICLAAMEAVEGGNDGC